MMGKFSKVKKPVPFKEHIVSGKKKRGKYIVAKADKYINESQKVFDGMTVNKTIEEALDKSQEDLKD